MRVKKISLCVIHLVIDSLKSKSSIPNLSLKFLKTNGQYSFILKWDGIFSLKFKIPIFKFVKNLQNIRGEAHQLHYIREEART